MLWGALQSQELYGIFQIRERFHSWEIPKDTNAVASWSLGWNGQTVPNELPNTAALPAYLTHTHTHTHTRTHIHTSIHTPWLTYIPKEVEKIYLCSCFLSEDKGGNYFVSTKNFLKVFLSWKREPSLNFANFTRLLLAQPQSTIWMVFFGVVQCSDPDISGDLEFLQSVRPSVKNLLIVLRCVGPVSL